MTNDPFAPATATATLDPFAPPKRARNELSADPFGDVMVGHSSGPAPETDPFAPARAGGLDLSGLTIGARLAAGAAAESGGDLLKIPGMVAKNAGREIVDTFQRLSQLAGGVPYTAALGIRSLVGKTGLPMEQLDPTLEQEQQTFGHALGAAGPAILDDLKQEAIDLATNPAGRFIRKPVTTALDVSAAAALPGALARGGARVAAKAAQAAERAGAAVGLGDRLGAVSARVDEATHALDATAVAQRASKELESVIPAYGAFAEDRRQVAAVQKVISDSTREFYRRRAQEFGKLDETLHPLAPAERERFADVVMGLEPLAEDATPAFREALSYWRNLSAQEQADLVNAGRLTERAAVMRRFQPQRIAAAADKELQLELERAAKTPGGIKRADKTRLTQEAAQAELERQTTNLLIPRTVPKGIQVLSEDGSRRAVEALAVALEKAGDELPVYFPFLKASEDAPWDFLPQKPPARPKAGFLKSSVGRLLATGQLQKDPAIAIARHRAQVIKFESAEKEVGRILALPFVRKIKDAAEVNPKTEMLFAPSGVLKFYRGQVKFTGQFFDELAKAGDMEEALVATIRSFLHSPEHSKSFLGVMGSDDLFAVPRGVGRELRAQFAPTPPWIRTLFDRPTDYWRYLVLSLRPAWLVNNVVGNTLFSILAGTSPSAYLKALSKRYTAALPADLLDSGMVQNEFRVIKLGGASDTRLGKMITALEDFQPAKIATWPMRKVSELSLKANAATDNYFRQAAFISKVEQLAGAQRVKTAGAHMLDAMDFAGKIDKLGPEGVQKALDHVNTFFNDFSRSSPFERRVLRRVFPFVSFLRHVFVLTMRLPIQYPGRTALLNRMAQFAKEAQEDRFEQLGVDPANLPGYRKTAFPVAKDDAGNIRVLSTGGFNPFSGLGLNSGDMVLEPNAGAMLHNLAGATHPGLQAAYEYVFGRDLGMDRPFTAPGVVELDGHFYAEDPSTPEGFREVGPPRPGIGHMVGSSIPQVQLYRSYNEPYKTFDLPGPEGYTPAPVRGDLAPANISPFEKTAAYLGAPVRTLKPEQLAKRPVNPRDAAKIRREFDRRRAAADQARKERKAR